MEGLLRRLSAEGSEAENALRVVAFFDQLVEYRSSSAALVRSTARLIGAPAGFASDSHGASWSFDAFGGPLASSIPAGALTKTVDFERGISGRVWILPQTANYALADLVLERMAIAAGTIIGRDTGEGAQADVVALAGLLDTGTTAEDRQGYAQNLGFRATWKVRVLLVRSRDSARDAVKLLAALGSALGGKVTSPLQGEGAAIALLHDPELAPAVLPDYGGVLAALGPSVALTDAAESLDRARLAMRLCSDFLGPRSIVWDTMGSSRHLASVDAASAKSDPMIVQLTSMLETDSGRAELLALNALCQHSSLRSAATIMGLHHSSLANRLDNASRKLGVNLSNPSDRFDLAVALQLFRVANSV